MKRQAPAERVDLAGRAPPPRGREGTQSGRILRVRNVATPMRSGTRPIVVIAVGPVGDP